MGEVHKKALDTHKAESSGKLGALQSNVESYRTEAAKTREESLRTLDDHKAHVFQQFEVLQRVLESNKVEQGKSLDDQSEALRSHFEETVSRRADALQKLIDTHRQEAQSTGKGHKEELNFLKGEVSKILETHHRTVEEHKASLGHAIGLQTEAVDALKARVA